MAYPMDMASNDGNQGRLRGGYLDASNTFYVWAYRPHNPRRVHNPKPRDFPLSGLPLNQSVAGRDASRSGCCFSASLDRSLSYGLRMGWFSMTQFIITRLKGLVRATIMSHSCSAITRDYSAMLVANTSRKWPLDRAQPPTSIGPIYPLQVRNKHPSQL